MKNITYINAGAGSGKTYTLTEKLAETLRPGSGVRPDQIILTTFTEKAANEFKEKSKAKLFEKGLFEEANMLDGALIGTIHSVAYSIISKFWYYLGLSPQLRIMTDEDNAVYLSQSLGAIPSQEELTQLWNFARMFGMVDSRSNTDYNFWQAHLKSIIGFTTNYEIADYQPSIEKSQALYSSFIRKDINPIPTREELERAFDTLEDFLEIQKENKTNNDRKRDLKEYRKVLTRREGKLPYTFYTKVYKLFNATDGIKKLENVAPLRERLEGLWHSEELNQQVMDYIALIFELADRWRTQYQEFKKERTLLDFNDLEKYLYQLLQDERAVKEIGAQYTHIFVDEFQDCSPIQVKIFRALADVAEQSYWVGDLKQSIFGFRGSDTDLISAVIESVEGSQDCKSETLGYSWRSVPEVVDFCNTVFTRAFSPDIPESKVRLEPRKSSCPGIPPLRIISTPKGEEEGWVNITRHLIDEGAKPNEIAILYRQNPTGDKLSRLIDEFDKQGIPLNLGTTNIMDSRAAQLAKAVLSAVEDDRDILAKAEIAYLTDERYDTSSLISEILATIDENTGRPDFSFLEALPLISKISESRRRLKHQSVASMVESVILEMNLFEEAKRCCSGKEAEAVLSTMIEAAKSYEESSERLEMQPSIKGFIERLQENKTLLPGDSDGVNLLTMHKSKGLEWKYVIVTSLDKNPGNEKEILKKDFFGVHFRRSMAPAKENLFPDVYISLHPYIFGNFKSNVPERIADIIMSGPDFEDIVTAKISEETRLLYVAMTRPSHSMILALKNMDKIQWLADMGLEDFSRAEALTTRYGFRIIPPAEAKESECLELEEYTFAASEPAGMERRNFSPSNLEGKAEIKRHHSFGHRIPMNSLPNGIEMDTVGNCIHHIFRMAGAAFPTEKIVDRIISGYGLSDTLPDRREIGESWHRLLQHISDHHGRVKAIGHERPFVMHSEGRIYTGSIDLTVETDQGTVLVDYKTCPMGDEAILNSLGKHYAGLYGGQLKCYHKALTDAGEQVAATYIYYPVAGLIVEI